MDKDKRKEIINDYKQKPVEMGIYQIRNMINGKILVRKARNFHAEKNKWLLGFKIKACEIKELQDVWDALGEKGVCFEIIDKLEPKKDSPNYNYYKDLVTLEELWLEKLQPYGDKGYNELQKPKN